MGIYSALNYVAHHALRQIVAGMITFNQPLTSTSTCLFCVTYINIMNIFYIHLHTFLHLL